MGRCAMIWTTAGTNRVCPRCLALKGTVVGYTNELGVTLPPIHPRCRCTIEYREIEPPKVLTTPQGNGNVTPRGLAAGDRTIDFVGGGTSPYLIGHIDFKDDSHVKQALDWFESIAVTAPVENALIITVAGEAYHCSGTLNELTTILELGEKLRGAIVTHNHPVGSDNEYSFSDDDKDLFMDFNLARLRGFDEKFIYEFNRNPKNKEKVSPIENTNKFNARHNWVAEMAISLGIGYRRWTRG